MLAKNADQKVFEKVPLPVKEAITHKWLRYCKQTYLSKVMIVRKTFLRLKPDHLCWLIFWQTYRDRNTKYDDTLDAILRKLRHA